ncbi:unnamed protein product [Penicillium nalgiovense]|nr:unnamed protein product [Penicillium nalgiovense]
MEIYIDGGIRRGTDILKALALGATAVGIGRSYLYSLTYGQEGAEHLTQILKNELVSAMKLSGITHIDQVIYLWSWDDRHVKFRGGLWYTSTGRNSLRQRVTVIGLRNLRASKGLTVC